MMTAEAPSGFDTVPLGAADSCSTVSTEKRPLDTRDPAVLPHTLQPHFLQARAPVLGRHQPISTDVPGE